MYDVQVFNYDAEINQNFVLMAPANWAYLNGQGIERRKARKENPRTAVATTPPKILVWNQNNSSETLLLFNLSSACPVHKVPSHSFLVSYIWMATKTAEDW